MLEENGALQVSTRPAHYPTSNLRVLFPFLMICLYLCQHSCVPGPVLPCWKQEPRNLGMCPFSGHIFTYMKPTWKKAQAPGPGRHSLTKALPFPFLCRAEALVTLDFCRKRCRQYTVTVRWGKREYHFNGGVWSMMC